MYLLLVDFETQRTKCYEKLNSVSWLEERPCHYIQE